MLLAATRMSSLTALVLLHHHVRASGVDYAGVFLAAGVSWATVPGPGEAALVAAGISAAHGRLDLAGVMLAAWTGASAGGMSGWIIGRKAGRAPLTAPGPLHHLRLRLIAKGDRFFELYGPIAVFLTPSWVAGIHAMRPLRFLPANVLAALVWSVSIGLGADLVGPSITDVASDVGIAGAGVVIVLIVAGLFAITQRA